MAKESLMDPIDMHELLERGPSSKLEELRIEIFEKVNALGIGAQGLGGLTTVLDVKIRTFPTHAASKPVAMIPNCAATRHAHFVLDGSGPVALDPPSLDLWPDVHWKPSAQSRRVNLDALTQDEVRGWKPGQTLLLSGRMLTGRDAAHKRLAELLDCGQGAARRPARARDLLRRARRSGAWRGRRTRGTDDGDAHGQVHRPDAREDRACSRWSARPSAGRSRSSRSGSTAPRT